MLIEALTPLKVRMHGRELFMDPGQPQDLPDADARRLLAKVPDKVRIVEPAPVVINVVTPADGVAKPIYFEDVYGRILGPATPEFLARDGDDFWIVTTMDGCTWWIRSEQLRSRIAFETQVPVRIVEPIRTADLMPTKPNDRRRR
jgi:hypothetical protein